MKYPQNWQELLAPGGRACEAGRDWLLTQPDPLTAYKVCPDGSFLHWVLPRLGVDLPVTLAYRATTRAIRHVSDWLDRLGVENRFRGCVVDSEESADAAMHAAAGVIVYVDALFSVTTSPGLKEELRSVACSADAVWDAAGALWRMPDSCAVMHSLAYVAEVTSENATADAKELEAQANDVRELVPEAVIIQALNKKFRGVL